MQTLYAPTPEVPDAEVCDRGVDVVVRNRSDGYRTLANRIIALTQSDPDLMRRYKVAKAIVRAFRKPAFYEISQRCNLWCEGCYFYEDEHRSRDAREPAGEAWEAFFRAEEDRGVSIAYFVGAEPALEQQRLRAAVSRVGFGKVGTNGTIRIDPDIPFRIGISMWGDEGTDARLRGGAVLRKALKNYEGDPRAIMLFTISPWNIDTIIPAIRLCADHGLKITFNLFSPTRTYLNKIASDVPHDGQFFRLANKLDNPCFSNDDLGRVAAMMDDVLAEFPRTVVYSRAYNSWVTRPGPLYEIDPASGVARDCASRIVPPLTYYGGDLSARQVKCCTPDVDCRQCRLYSGGWSSKFVPHARDVASPAAFSDWLGMMETIGEIFLYPNPAASP